MPHPPTQICTGAGSLSRFDVYGEVYFDKVTGLCKECPDVSTRLAAPLGLVGALLALVLVVGLIYRACKDRALQRPIYVAKRVMLRVQQLEKCPKVQRHPG